MSAAQARLQAVPERGIRIGNLFSCSPTPHRSRPNQQRLTYLFFFFALKFLSFPFSLMLRVARLVPRAFGAAHAACGLVTPLD